MVSQTRPLQYDTWKLFLSDHRLEELLQYRRRMFELVRDKLILTTACGFLDYPWGSACWLPSQEVYPVGFEQCLGCSSQSAERLILQK